MRKDGADEQTDAESSTHHRLRGQLSTDVLYCFVLGWILARATDSPIAAYGSFGFASVVGLWALYLRFFRVWTPEKVTKLRKRLARVLLVALKAMGVATILFILYLMVRNN